MYIRDLDKLRRAFSHVGGMEQSSTRVIHTAGQLTGRAGR